MIIFIRKLPQNASWGSNQKLPDCIVLAVQIRATRTADFRVAVR